MKQNYKMILQYDGTRYNGWQKQGNTVNTIQGKLEELLFKLSGEKIEVHGSGRTDAGVHALGQVANFYLDIKMTAEDIRKYINRYLPEDIAVISLEPVNERFHSRLTAVGKTYCYRIYTGSAKPVFDRKFMYIPDEMIQMAEKTGKGQIFDIAAMKQAAACLTGVHDFKSFCGNKRMKKSTVREIVEIRIEQKENELCMNFTGNGFLQNMVRIMVGTLLEVGVGMKKPEQMEDILKGRERSLAGFMAPARGLTLVCVSYEQIPIKESEET